MIDEFKEAAAYLYYQIGHFSVGVAKSWDDLHPTAQEAARFDFAQDWKVFVETCPHARVVPVDDDRQCSDPRTATIAFQGRLKQTKRVVGKETASTLIQTFKLAAHRCGGILVIDK